LLSTATLKNRIRLERLVNLPGVRRMNRRLEARLDLLNELNTMKLLSRFRAAKC